MDIIKELKELKETISNEIAEANKEIKKAGGDLNVADIDMIDKLTHAMKSVVTTCARLEAEEDGYSESYPWPRQNARDGYSGNYGGYTRNNGRDSRNKYSRMDWNERLRMMMDEAPDEQTRMDIKRMMDRMAN